MSANLWHSAYACVDFGICLGESPQDRLFLKRVFIICCVSARERERKREIEQISSCICMHLIKDLLHTLIDFWICVCVCSFLSIHGWVLGFDICYMHTHTHTYTHIHTRTHTHPHYTPSPLPPHTLTAHGQSDRSVNRDAKDTAANHRTASHSRRRAHQTQNIAARNGPFDVLNSPSTSFFLQLCFFGDDLESSTWYF